MTIEEISKEENAEFLGECDKLKKLTDEFAEQMFLKLTYKAQKGWRKWDDPDFADHLQKELIEHINRNDWSIKNMIDVANLAAFLWWQAREKSFKSFAESPHQRKE